MRGKNRIIFIVAMMMFGSIGVFVRGINMPSSVIALARGFFGAAVLLIFSLALRRHSSFKAIKRNLLPLSVAAGALGFNWMLLFEAYKHTSIATATLCYYLSPVIVVLLSPVIFKERLTLKRVLCIVGSLLGMALVAEVFGGVDVQWTGILSGVAAAVFYSVVVISNRFFKDISSTDTAIFQLGGAAAVMLVYVLATGDIVQARSDLQSVLLLAFVCIVLTGFCYLAYFYCIQRLNSQTVAVLSYLDPLTAIVLSVTVLAETPSVSKIIGAVLILGCTLISEYTTKSKA